MINVSDETKEAFLTSSTQKTIYIEFPNKNIVLSNDDIVSESFELKQALEDERNLTFKGCIASQVKFQAAEIAEDLRGELMTVSIQAGNTETIKLFTGYVESQSNLTQEDFVTNIVAYDAFYKMGNLTIGEFWDITFEFTFQLGFRKILKYLDDNYGLLGYNENRDYYNSLIETTYEKLEQESGESLIHAVGHQALNGSVKIVEVMRYLCQSFGVYGYIDGNGLFNFKELNPFNRGTYPGQNTIPANDLFPAGENTEIIFDKSEYISASYVPYDVKKITALKVYLPAGQTEIYDNTPAYIKTLDFGDNSFFLMTGANTWNRLAKAALFRVGKIWYKPSMIGVAGRPWVELGDSYIYTTRKNIVRSYVLKRTLKGIQSLYDTYESEGEEKKDDDIFESGSGLNVDAMSMNIGTESNSGYISVNGHEVTFKDITISGTTYHLLGYTD